MSGRQGASYFRGYGWEMVSKPAISGKKRRGPGLSYNDLFWSNVIVPKLECAGEVWEGNAKFV